MKIQEIHTAPVPCIADSDRPAKKRLLSYDNLPTGTKHRFKKILIPISIETTGALKPWVIPDDKTLTELWNLVFGAEHHIEDNDLASDYFIVAKTLVSHGKSERTHYCINTM